VECRLLCHRRVSHWQLCMRMRSAMGRRPRPCYLAGQRRFAARGRADECSAHRRRGSFFQALEPRDLEIRLMGRPSIEAGVPISGVSYENGKGCRRMHAPLPKFCSRNCVKHEDAVAYGLIIFGIRQLAFVACKSATFCSVRWSRNVGQVSS
jgi:hypothetical protein